MNVNKKAKGLVTKKFNDFFYVNISEGNQLKEGVRFLCKSRKNVYFQKQVIVVGDEVIISEISFKNKTAIIETLLERKNLFERPSVANISNIYVIISAKEPQLNFSQVNKFLISAESLFVKVSLVLTKCDLINTQIKNQFIQRFESWGYFPKTLNLLKENSYKYFLQELEKNKCSIFIGPSGVGKTTILNKIIPNLNNSTSPVSRKIKRGKNTTRNIELFSLSKNSYIVDTPGFNIPNLNINNKLVINLFPELRNQLFKESLNCKFRNCLHTHEPGCALDKHLERYKYYKELIDSSKNHHSQIQGD